MKDRSLHLDITGEPDREIVRTLACYWGVSEEELNRPFKVIAKYRKVSQKDSKGREYGYFEDIRNTNGELLYFSDGVKKPKVFVLHRDSFAANDYWQINVRIVSSIEQLECENFLIMNDFVLNKPSLSLVDKLEKEKFIRTIFAETGSTGRDAKNISNALHAIMGDLYTETERFIYELLQNADDYPQGNSLVNVTLKTLNENFLFMHSGKPFSEADVESLSSIGDSTKKMDIEKTGYKGIGFKSVFSDAETVFIDSGNFSFAFDKKSPIYSGEEDMDVIPWQIKPIWEEKYRLPKEIQEESLFFSSPVGIALNVGVDNIDKYDRTIPELLLEPRFALFLRNIGRIRFESLRGNVIEIKKVVNDGMVRVESNDVIEDWIIKDYIVDIPDETKDLLQDEKLVPEKLKETTKTKITFAAKVVEDTIIPIDESVIFTYLPTKVDDFGFKFLVNADFLTTANRESIHFKNIWNRFLFEKIGSLLVKWVSSIESCNASLCLLPLTKKELKRGGNCSFDAFSNSFLQSILEAKFFKGHNGSMVAQDKIMIDKSALSKIIGKDLFCNIIDSRRLLLAFDADENMLKDSDLFDSILIATTDIVLNKIATNKFFLNWFRETSTENKYQFYTWLIEHEKDVSKESIVKVVENLPLYCFSDRYLFKREIAETQVVLRNEHMSLLPVYRAIGLECSNNIDELPIARFYSNNIVEQTLEYVFKHLRCGGGVAKWLACANEAEKKVMADWLESKDITSTQHDLIVKFVETLPIFIFDDKNYRRSDIVHLERKRQALGNYSMIEKLDNKRIIITNKLSSIVPLLVKMGFVCSSNIDESPFVRYITPIDEFEIYHTICNRMTSALKNDENLFNPSEKLELFKVLKKLEGVGEATLKDMLLFRNMNGDLRPLKEMVSYREEVPEWLYPYVICKDDFFIELSSCLVAQKDEFKDIIQKNLSDIDASWGEIYDAYKDRWTGQFTRYIVDKFVIDNENLFIVEESDLETKKYFLNSIKSLAVYSDSEYDTDSFECRVVKMILSICEEPSAFSSKIYFDEQCISDFSVSDDVICEYHQNGENKKIKLYLAELLPQYQKQSDALERIKALLCGIKDLNKFFVVKPKAIKDIYHELKEVSMNSVTKEWNVNAQQYLFLIYYARCVCRCSTHPNIDLSKASEAFVCNLLELLYINDVSIKEYPFESLKKYFWGKCFDSEYIYKDEQLLPIIEKWADNERRLAYLEDNGVQTLESNIIRFRKLFIEDKDGILDFINEISRKDLANCIEFIATYGELPFVGKNQKDVLLYLKKNKCCNLKDCNDETKMKERSKEWESQEYKEWIKDHYPKMLIYPGSLPRQLLYKDKVLLNYDDHKGYFYDKDTRQLFISNTRKIEDILFEVANDAKSDLEFDDYKELCLDGKVSISKEDIDKKDKTIESLEESNRKKEEIIEQYRAKYGDLADNNYFSDSESQVLSVNTFEKIHSNAQTEIELQKGDPIERDGLSREKQISAHKEAENVIKDKLENVGYDCSNWVLGNDDNNQYRKNHSINQVENIISPDGEKVNLVVKSVKGGYIYLSAADFEFLTSDSNNILMVWDGKNVHSVTAEDIFNKDSNVNLIFDTKYTPKHYYAALSKVFQYIKRTTFAVKKPYYNVYDSIKSFGMDSKTEGVQELFSDNDL